MKRQIQASRNSGPSLLEGERHQRASNTHCPFEVRSRQRPWDYQRAQPYPPTPKYWKFENIEQMPKYQITEMSNVINAMKIHILDFGN